jgi:hypothetical protein
MMIMTNSGKRSWSQDWQAASGHRSLKGAELSKGQRRHIGQPRDKNNSTGNSSDTNMTRGQLRRISSASTLNAYWKAGAERGASSQAAVTPARLARNLNRYSGKSRYANRNLL